MGFVVTAKKGFFITFEGIEGCGKTTQLRLLKERLQADGRQVLATREPGGCPIADKVRAILLDAENSAMTPSAELLLYAAARAQHVQEMVVPALERGEIVLCDRFTDATVAYQGHGRGLNLDLIGQLNEVATCGVAPGLTILMDCPVETGLSRARARIESTEGDREERFELESMRFHERVRAGYLKLAHDNPARFIVIDAARGVEETAEAIERALAGRLPAAHTGTGSRAGA